MNRPNHSKPSLMVCYPIPDVHDAPPRTAGSLPIVTTERLQRDTTKASAAYCEGHASGQRWAVEAASFADLERMALESRSPFFVAPAWLRGFADAVAEMWADMNSVALES
jgi:hypothetical protein